MVRSLSFMAVFYVKLTVGEWISLWYFTGEKLANLVGTCLVDFSSTIPVLILKFGRGGQYVD